MSSFMKTYPNLEDQPINNSLNETVAAYVKTIDAKLLAGGSARSDAYVRFIKDKELLSRAIRVGIPFVLFEEIRRVTPFTEIDWAEYLNVSTKTLQRYKISKTRFKPIYSEKILELAEVTQLGTEVFDSQGQFYNWLNTVSFALGNLKPAELLKDSYGKELVMAELNRIEHGVFA